jgi:hypothetical protein
VRSKWHATNTSLLTISRVEMADVSNKDQKENQDYGLIDLDSNRCTSSTAKKSPAKDSSSMRKRLLGSMRKIGSMRSLQLSPTKASQSGDSPIRVSVEPEVCKYPSSSLHTFDHQFLAYLHSNQINHTLSHARFRA